MSCGFLFPGDVCFTGTVSAPLFASTQQVIAPIAAGTASTLTFGSISGTFSSILQSYAATLSTLNLIVGQSSSPAATLDVSGSARVTGSIAASLGLIGSQSTNNQILNLIPAPVGTNLTLSFGGVSGINSGLGSFLNIVSPVAAASNWSSDALAGDTVMRAGTGFMRMYAGSGASPAQLVVSRNNCIGINNANPTNALDVTGNARVSGQLTCSKVVPWTAISPQNGASAGTAQYCVDELGYVMLRGTMTFPTSVGAIAFVLPAGARPFVAAIIPVVTTNNSNADLVSRLFVQTSGAVQTTPPFTNGTSGPYFQITDLNNVRLSTVA